MVWPLGNLGCAGEIKCHFMRKAQPSYSVSQTIDEIITQVSYEYIDGLVQKRLNSSALAMELSLSCTNLSICIFNIKTLMIKSYYYFAHTIAVQLSAHVQKIDMKDFDKILNNHLIFVKWILD